MDVRRQITANHWSNGECHTGGHTEQSKVLCLRFGVRQVGDHGQRQQNHMTTAPTEQLGQKYDKNGNVAIRSIERTGPIGSGETQHEIVEGDKVEEEGHWSLPSPLPITQLSDNGRQKKLSKRRYGNNDAIVLGTETVALTQILTCCR